jgi:hypothetical protein
MCTVRSDLPLTIYPHMYIYADIWNVCSRLTDDGKIVKHKHRPLVQGLRTSVLVKYFV